MRRYTSIVSCTKKFNNEQQNVFNTILGEIILEVTANNPEFLVECPFNHHYLCPHARFLDAPGGIGKTFTIRAIQSVLRLRKHKVIAVPFSDVAASLLDDCRTAHSSLKTTINCRADSVCNTSLESNIAHQLPWDSLTTWSKILICLRCCIDPLRVIIKSPNVSFVRKCVLFSRDFQQILHVVPRDSRGMILYTWLQSSPLHQCMDFLGLSKNMRLQAILDDQEKDPAVLEYLDFPLKAGDEKRKWTEYSLIELPLSVNIVEFSTKFVESLFLILK